VIEIVKHMDDLWHLAQVLVKSGMLPRSVESTEAAVAIMLKGRELGIGPMHAFDSITVIQGKPGASPQLMIALINRSGFCEQMDISDDGNAAVVTMKRRGRAPHTERFGMDDAELFMTSEWINKVKREIPLSQKHNWKSQPKTMRKWRAVAACARIVFPDVIAGMYTPDELGAMTDQDGKAIDVEVISGGRPQQKLPDQGSEHGKTGSYAKPALVKECKIKIRDINKEASERWVENWEKCNSGVFPHSLSESPVPNVVVSRIVLMAAILQGKLQPVEMGLDAETGESFPRASVEQTLGMIAIIAEKEPRWFEATVRGAFSQEMTSLANQFASDNPSFELPAEYEAYEEGPPVEDESQEEPPPASTPPKRMTKLELAEKTRDRLEAAKLASAPPPGSGDAWEEPGEAERSVP